MYSHNTFEYKLDYYIFSYIKNISIKTKTIAYAWYIYSLDYKTHTCIYIYIGISTLNLHGNWLVLPSKRLLITSSDGWANEIKAPSSDKNN
jgi:hypothetical protein